MNNKALLIFASILCIAISGCSTSPERNTSKTAQTVSAPAESQARDNPDSNPDRINKPDTQNEPATQNAPGEQSNPDLQSTPDTQNNSDTQNKSTITTVTHPDWASYFGELNGSAVIFDPAENTFHIYQESLADTRRSPCSTFKIISSLAGLENGIIVPENSTRVWSGETFWNKDWNRDIDFYSAFKTSCVWYYRQVIDDIGKAVMQETLDSLQYGNCNLSNWSGNLNLNNSNPALTGFWIESSLKISPREQTIVLEKIFGNASKYTARTREVLEEVMFLAEASSADCAVYGKTGMGKANGVVVDAWYTGFADVGHRIYFCVYLGETANQNVSSTRAREIAVSLLDLHHRQMLCGR